MAYEVTVNIDHNVLDELIQFIEEIDTECPMNEAICLILAAWSNHRSNMRAVARQSAIARHPSNRLRVV